MTLKSFGELEVGDYIPGADGLPVKVVEAYEEHLPATMYHLEFDNGKTLDASGNHLLYVEGAVDKSLYSSRIKAGKKLLADMPLKLVKELLKLALTYDEPVEASLDDMIVLLHANGNSSLVSLLTRVALSIGPIAEETIVYQDLATEEQLNNTTVRKYDARLFAQQLLALKEKRYRKRWPVIRGRVVTVEEALLMEDNLEVPEVPGQSHSLLERFYKR